MRFLLGKPLKQTQIHQCWRLQLPNYVLYQQLDTFYTQMNSPIKLTTDETELVECLEKFVSESGLQTVMRIAGGWVRDKLLNINSYDIDISLDNCTGVEFASKLNAWLETKQKDTHRIGVIKCNPEQSKHLETATVRLAGLSIDFVNLRTETYAVNSRIPENVTFGTALEDARRRDLTFNALFYNLNTKEVEDLTGMGLEDLKNGLIRTPLDPLVTLLEDPLRTLRVIRFASRFGFEVASCVQSACTNSQVHNALGSKVSKERIGKEIQTMIACKHPERGFALIYEYGLAPIIFESPTTPISPRSTGSNATSNEDQTKPPTLNEDVFAAGLQATDRLCPLLADEKRREADTSAHEETWDQDVRILWLGAFLHGFYGSTAIDAKGKFKNTINWQLTDCLHFPRRDSVRVETYLASANGFLGLMKEKEPTRRQLGEVLRLGVGGNWPLAILLAASMSPSDQPALKVLEERIREVIGDEPVWNIAALYSGEKLRNILPALPNGPSFKNVLQEEIGWMLENPMPAVDSAEYSVWMDDCKMFLQTKFPQFVSRKTSDL
eukprot:Platyproteum_vivax@DN2706_c0_g1_i1.p1